MISYKMHGEPGLGPFSVHRGQSILVMGCPVHDRENTCKIVCALEDGYRLHVPVAARVDAGK